jgi:hypothetical protein
MSSLDFRVGLRRKRLRELSHTMAWARPLNKRAGSAARQFRAQLSMQPPLLHSSGLRLRPSV